MRRGRSLAGRQGSSRRSGRWWIVLAGLVLSTSSCDFWYNRVPSPDDLWHILPFMDHMITARYVRPYQDGGVPRNTPEGAVPVGGGEPDWSGEWTTGKTTTANALRNPYAQGGTAETWAPGPDVARIHRSVEAAGDTLYQNFCAVCHGAAGDAKGPVSSRIGAPSLLTGRARGYSDGYIYSIIRYGRGVMPRYGDKVYQPEERWAIVNHVRKLQARTPPPEEPPGASAPIPPAPSATGSTGVAPR